VTKRTLLVVLCATSAFAATKPDRDALVVRGHEQIVHHVAVEGQPDAKRPAVLFLPGDGGWRGAAVDMARMISSLGYEVYALDVKRYLTTSTKGHSALSEAQMAADLDAVEQWVASVSERPVVLAGWSQGAAMVVLAGARMEHRDSLTGVLTIALPEAGALGWRWRDTLLSVFRRDPHEPEFHVAPLLPEVAPLPVYMVYGTNDRFTPAQITRRLTRLARRPRRRHEIEGGNHGLDRHRADLRRSLEAGLGWLMRIGGRGGIRTPDPGVANAVLSQLSYTPTGGTTDLNIARAPRHATITQDGADQPEEAAQEDGGRLGPARP
jgi:dienelactone hydrolase